MHGQIRTVIMILKVEHNAGEIERAVALANKYPDIVKIIAVGNEAMVKWAASLLCATKCDFKMGESFTRIKENRETS